jgi:uncharacterized protein
VTEVAETRGVPLPPWTAGDLVKALLLCVLFGVGAVVVLLLAGLALRFAGIRITQSSPVLVIALIVIQNASFLVGVWAFGPRKYHVGLDRLGLRPYVAGAGCALAAAGLVVAFGFNAFYSLMLGGLGHTIEETPVLPLFGGGLLGFAVALFLVSIVAPFVEEILFRGFVFPGLVRRFGFLAGLLLSSALFGAAHLSPDTFVPLSFFGIVLGLLYSATGSILPGIVLHSVNNSVALLAAYFVGSGLLSR